MAESRQESSASRCDRVREWLPEFDYGGPGLWQRWHVARHLKRCPECARELETLRRAVALIESIPEVSPPADLWERVAGELRREGQSASSTRVMRQLPALTAAAVLAASAGLFVWHRPEPAVAPQPMASYVRSHLALSSSQPFAPSAGLDALVLISAGENAP
ncbi:MAG TPA: zf-HC2 domain-containing protein [Armatimonadota bacterium]|nr:zf-HC2 domain-containing protein [Armatimonadota bacterium]